MSSASAVYSSRASDDALMGRATTRHFPCYPVRSQVLFAAVNEVCFREICGGETPNCDPPRRRVITVTW